jgi:hypothetical protein
VGPGSVHPHAHTPTLSSIPYHACKTHAPHPGPCSQAEPMHEQGCKDWLNPQTGQASHQLAGGEATQEQGTDSSSQPSPGALVWSRASDRPASKQGNRSCRGFGGAMTRRSSARHLCWWLVTWLAGLDTPGGGARRNRADTVHTICHVRIR